MTRAITTEAQQTAAGRYLDSLPWAHITGGFDALGHRYALRTTHGPFGRFVERAFSALASPSLGSWRTTYSLVHRATSRDGRYALYADDERLVAAESPSLALSTLAWHVNRQVVATNRHLVLVHAAAAERDGLGVVLAGAMEAGKTTLVAGLVRHGWRYLTDEIVAIEPHSGVIRPYPKPLSVDPGSFDVLADLRPDVEPGVEPFLRGQWQVDPHSIRTDAVAGPTEVRVVIVTRYVGGGATRIEPLPRREMLLELIEQTFHFHAAGARNVTALAAVLGGARCYRLQVGKLDAACRLIERVRADRDLEPGGGM